MKHLLFSRTHASPLIEQADQFVLSRAALKKFVKSRLELANMLPDLERKLLISTCRRMQGEIKNMPPQLLIKLS